MKEKMIFKGILLFLLFGISLEIISQVPIIFEAEEATLSGIVSIVDCNSASGGKMVKDLKDGIDNSVRFDKIDLSEAGRYFVTVSYFSTNERELTYRINDGEDVNHDIPASGLWCFQGGLPGDYTFEESFLEGMNSILFYNSPLIDKIVISSDTSARNSTTFYLSSTKGNDENDGMSNETPWKTIKKINSLSLVPGDSLLFRSGETFEGELIIANESGSADHPIVVSSYGSGDKPILDGIGYGNTVHVLNSGYLHFTDLEIKNDGGPPQPNEPTETRYGIYFENTYSDGTVYRNYRLRDITFKNIYPTDQITDNDNIGITAHAIITSGSWMDEENPDRFVDMIVEDCLFTRIGRHAAFFKAVRDLIIRNNLFEHVGGAGMVIGNNSSDILVENNVTNYTGSSIDSRMAGRGSGIWCFRSKNLTVQYNKFMHAKGIHDSYGMHIDIGNRNVVYQYNYSEDNEGGFVEILGANVNVGYRYNLSVGDGWRKRGNRYGQIFWFSGWSGDPMNPIGSDSIFVYNNSIYIRDSIEPGIHIAHVTERARIFNNIIYVANNFGEIIIGNDPGLNDFNNNIWYGNIPNTDAEGDPFMGNNALFSDPLFAESIISEPDDFTLKNGSPAFNSGKLIYDETNSGEYNYYDSHGGKDYFNNVVSTSEPPNIGAYNLSESTSLKNNIVEDLIQLFPNPIVGGQDLYIELPDNFISYPLSIQLFDLSGRLYLTKEVISDYKIKIKTDRLKAGIYLINIKSENHEVTKKILLIH